MSTEPEQPQRTAYWGTCSNEQCLASMVIYPHPEAKQDLPDEDDWENSTFYINCPVCNGGMDWGGSDPAADIIRNYRPERTAEA